MSGTSAYKEKERARDRDKNRARNQEEKEDEDDDEVAPNVLEEDTSRSLAATLKLAKAKGYVDRDVKRQPSSSIGSAKRAKIEATAYMVDERRAADDRKGEFRSRARGEQLREVREPVDYKPEIKLEYTDDAGRKLKTKEAYNYMCYKFHGKDPGKNKVDKRLRKQAIEARMKESLTTDLPPSASLMISKQEELQSPFIVLSKGK